MKTSVLQQSIWLAVVAALCLPESADGQVTVGKKEWESWEAWYGFAVLPYPDGLPIVEGLPVTLPFEERPWPAISEVEACSPAEEAGLRDGDLLISINGEDARQRPLPWGERSKPGTEKQLEIRRDGDLMRITVVAIAYGDRSETCERDFSPG